VVGLNHQQMHGQAALGSGESRRLYPEMRSGRPRRGLVQQSPVALRVWFESQDGHPAAVGLTRWCVAVVYRSSATRTPPADQRIHDLYDGRQAHDLLEDSVHLVNVHLRPEIAVQRVGQTAPPQRWCGRTVHGTGRSILIRLAIPKISDGGFTIFS
jgi:hypothetical protein